MAESKEWRYVWIDSRDRTHAARVKGNPDAVFVPPSLWQAGDERIRRYLAKVTTVLATLQQLTGN